MFWNEFNTQHNRWSDFAHEKAKVTKKVSGLIVKDKRGKVDGKEDDRISEYR